MLSTAEFVGVHAASSVKVVISITAHTVGSDSVGGGGAAVVRDELAVGDMVVGEMGWLCL